MTVTDSAPKLPPLFAVGPENSTAAKEDWGRRRAGLREQWQAFLGPFPANKAPLKTEILATEELPDFTRQYVRYQIEDGVTTDGYLLMPRGLTGRLPAVVVFHQTIKTQAQQAAGLDASNAELMHGVQLVRRGYVVLCPRCYIFNDGATYVENVTIMQQRHPEWKGMARMTWDAIRAADFLESLPNVEARRIGGLGHSLGAKEVLYAAAFDDRYKVAVFSEGGIGLTFTNWEAAWYLGPEIQRAQFSLEHHQLMALIAPRAFLLLVGDSADSDASAAYVEAVRPVFRLYGAENNVAWLNHHAGHRYPPPAQDAAEAFLDSHLRAQR
ncbi:MAG: dienelactone hydrolase [Opitutus sp.]|nr:dienelactone hydrolase [Opitutus sp.]